MTDTQQTTQQATQQTATFRVWRGDATGGAFKDYTTETAPGMVVLDAIHQIPGRPGQ